MVELCFNDRIKAFSRESFVLKFPMVADMFGTNLGEGGAAGSGAGAGAGSGFGAGSSGMEALGARTSGSGGAGTESGRGSLNVIPPRKSLAVLRIPLVIGGAFR